jgi:hypothetical protein
VIRFKVAQQPEVEKAEPSVRAENAVVRVRVAGDGAVTPHEAEVEAEGDLADTVALRVAEVLDLVGPQPFDILGDEHAARREVRVHAWQAHVRVTTEQSLEPALVLGLDLVVELVGDPLAYLGQQCTRIESRRHALPGRVCRGPVR